jgi:hypothetical protein
MDGYKITITHDADGGQLRDWRAEADGLLPGIGKTWGQALESLVRGNLAKLGIIELRTVDRFNANVADVTWRAIGHEET